MGANPSTRSLIDFHSRRQTRVRQNVTGPGSLLRLIEIERIRTSDRGSAPRRTQLHFRSSVRFRPRHISIGERQLRPEHRIVRDRISPNAAAFSPRSASIRLPEKRASVLREWSAWQIRSSSKSRLRKGRPARAGCLAVLGDYRRPVPVIRSLRETMPPGHGTSLASTRRFPTRPAPIA
jgi:hypothetical protein